MKKLLIMIIMLLSVVGVYSQQQNFRYDIEKIYERTTYIDSSDATVHDNDTLFFRTQPYYTELADSVFFIVEIQADSSNTGTAKDSIALDLGAEWLSPSNYSNTTLTLDEAGFSTQPFLGRRLATTTGSFFNFYAGSASYAKDFVKIRVWVRAINARPDARQKMTIRVFMVKYWVP